MSRAKEILANLSLSAESCVTSVSCKLQEQCMRCFVHSHLSNSDRIISLAAHIELLLRWKWDAQHKRSARAGDFLWPVFFLLWCNLLNAIFCILCVADSILQKTHTLCMHSNCDAKHIIFSMIYAMPVFLASYMIQKKTHNWRKKKTPLNCLHKKSERAPVFFSVLLSPRTTLELPLSLCVCASETMEFIGIGAAQNYW